MDTLESRRRRVAKVWDLRDEIVLVSCGEPAPIDGSDMVYPFRPHADMVYLSGVGIPGSVLAFDASADEWELFTPRATPDQLIWEQPTAELGRSLDELEEWLASRPGRQRRRAGAGGDAALAAGIGEVRLIKDDAELDAMARAAECTRAGFEWVNANARTGMTERAIQVAMEAEFFTAGAPRVAYDSIVASGPHGSYLHYGHALDDPLEPATRTIEAGDLLLIDAGAEMSGYASDVTRTAVVGAEPSDEQAFLWQLVARTQELAIDRCRPGVEWRDVHMDAARTIGTGLVELGLLRGAVDDLVAAGAVALFFPHGLGHLIGLTVHDAGGYPPDREPSPHPQLRYLRTDRPLQAGMVTSVEPGVYFIEALLADPARRDDHAELVVWDRVDELRGFGGIRIEDDVLVTDGEPHVITAAIDKPMRIG